MSQTQVITEDDIYRTSTQYRLWTFTPESLSALRANTHAAALERAKTYLHSQNGSASPAVLTLAEEVHLVQRYSDQLRTTSDHFKWPVNVKATAVQFLKRFYLTNSTMTYPPKEIYKTILFLASKTEGTHMTLTEYARRIKSNPADILAAEYKIIQALRFTLDVRQPFRGLKGALMELLNLAAGNAAVLPALAAADGATPATLQAAMARLGPLPPGSRSPWTGPGGGGAAPLDARGLADRAHCAYQAARGLLDAPALLTDVYLLFTPPQIYLAALRVADEPLAAFYLSTKLAAGAAQTGRVLATVARCAEMLAAFSAEQVMRKEERAALEEKLEACRDPGTRDLVRRIEEVREDKLSDEKLEKRRLARERSEKEGQDLFGPSLGMAA